MASQAVINLVVDASNADNQINAQVRRIVNDAERNAPPVNINVVVNNNSVTNITNDMRRLGDQTDDTNRRTGGLGSAFGKLGSAAGTLGGIAGKMGAVGVAAGGAIPAIASVAAAVGQIAPAAAAGVTALLTVKAAATVLQIGMMGVSDAIETAFDPEASPEDLAKAMENLAPEARKFVTELRSMRGAFQEVQLGVQNRLFKDFDESLSALAKETMPILERTAFRMADSFNAMGRGAATAAGEVAEDGTLGAALRSSTNAMETLEKVPARVVVAIAQIAEAGGPLLERFATYIDSLSVRMSEALNRGVASGGLESAVNTAGDALAQLGDIASNVGTTLSNVFDIAGQSGASLFDALENVTQALADVTATKAFSDALTTLIGVFQTLSSVLMPLFSAALEAILPVLEIIAPPIERLILLLGDQLMAIMPTVTEILGVLAEIFANLVLAVEPFIELILQLVEAILPLLLPILEVINEVLSQLGPIFAEIAAQLADALIPVFEALMPVIEMLAGVFLRLVEIILPVLVEILSGELIPLIAEWFAVMAELLVAMAPLIEAILLLAADIIEFLMPAISGVIGFISDFAGVLVGILRFAIENVAIPAIRFLTALLSGDFSAAWEMIQGLVGRVAGAIGRFVGNMVNTALDFLGNLMSEGKAIFVRAFQLFLGAVVQGAKNVVNTIKKLPGQAKRALGNMGTYLINSGKALIRGLINGIKSMIGSMVSTVKGALSKARDYLPFSPAKVGPFSGKGWTLYSGKAMMRDLAKGIDNQAPMLRNRMRDAVGGLSTSLDSNISAVIDPFNPNLAANDAGVYRTDFTTAAPKVDVYVGNEALTRYVDVRIRNNDDRRDRLAVQGVRR